MTQKVLVTGGAGFVGSVLCGQLLQMGMKVTCLDFLVKGDGDSILPYVTNKNFTFENENVVSPCIKPIVDQHDVVIHLAALVGAPKCKKDPRLSHMINVKGTENLVKCLSGQRLVFASTGSVYGKVEDICTEDSELNPMSEYGIDKFFAEKMVLDYNNSIAFRFATGCGVSNSMRINLLVNNLVYDAVHNKSICLFEADAKRTFISVRDMGRAFITGISRQGDYKVYNCGDASMNASKREMAELIKSKTECEVFYGDYLKDPDQRDYEVDYSRLNNSLHFKCLDNIETVIDQLIPAVKLLNVNGRYV